MGGKNLKNVKKPANGSAGGASGSRMAAAKAGSSKAVAINDSDDDIEVSYQKNGFKRVFLNNTYYYK
jgi:hypothetical protein